MKQTILGILVCLFLNSCSAVFEKPITDKNIIIYTPADSASSKIYSQQFYWEKVDGATRYRLQIASPDFIHPQTIVLDSIMSSNKLNVSLSPGNYEWRLRAENGGSETKYQTRALFIHQGRFEDQQLVVSRPAENTTTYSNTLVFEWNNIIHAESYSIEIAEETGSFSSPLQTISVDAPSLDQSVVLLKRGNYKWRMVADSAGIKSQYSASKKIYFKMDTVALTKPISNQTDLATTVVLEWSAPDNSKDEVGVSYMVYLYDSFNAVLSGYPKKVTTPSLTVADLNAGQSYYWAVRAIDANGTEGVNTSKRKFSVR